jgi:lipid-A-disaccharide synthase
VGLLPGSRDREIERHLPEMLAAAGRVARRRPDVRWTVSIAPGVDPAHVHRIIGQSDPTVSLETATGGVRGILAQSTLVVAASGTVTLEAAVAGTPTIIVYKVSALSYRLGRALIRVPFIGLANLIAEAPVVPELIQDQVTGENIAGHVLALLQNPARRRAMRTALARVRRRLGPPGASERVAAIAWRMLTAGAPPK